MISRPKKLQVGSATFCVPIYFPSVSSVKTALSLLDYVSFLGAMKTMNGQFLVSAYDLNAADASSREKVRQVISTARADGATVLVDSGNYESFWKGDYAEWKRTDFHRVLKEFSCDFAFAFDEQNPPRDRSAHLTLLLDHLLEDQAAAGSAMIIPIVHGAPEEIPRLCEAIAKDSGVPMIGVPERRLGNGVFARAKTVAAIRHGLDKMGRYVGLHLLGTGNPISLALYAISGADSFDGLEWCQVVADHESGLLFHFSQADFFLGQTTWGEAATSFHARILAHNLEFYTQWMHRLQRAIHEGHGIEFCRAHFPQRIFVQCTAAMGWKVEA